MTSIISILESIQRLEGHYFPRRELSALIAQPSESIPLLLELIEDVTANFGEYYDDEAYVGHLYAFFLLAQFREKRAYPLIAQYFLQHGDRAHTFCGDFVTEDLARVLASVFDGDLAPIEALIENPSVNEWVRSVSVRCLSILVIQEFVSREHVISYFKELFSYRLERKHEVVWEGLCWEAIQLYPDTLHAEIYLAFEDKLIDEFVFGPEYVTEALSSTLEAHLALLEQNYHYTLIQDIIEEMEGWAMYQPPRWKPESLVNRRSIPQPDPPLVNMSSMQKRKIGRNEPCHCGSGKKYKKCCLPKDRRMTVGKYLP